MSLSKLFLEENQVSAMETTMRGDLNYLLEVIKEA